MISRKQHIKKEKKVRIVNLEKIKKGFDHSTLQEAVVDNKLVATIGSELVVIRKLNGKEALHKCSIQSVSETGLVSVWDDTLQQCYAFLLSEPPKIIKILKMASVSKETS